MPRHEGQVAIPWLVASFAADAGLRYESGDELDYPLALADCACDRTQRSLSHSEPQESRRPVRQRRLADASQSRPSVWCKSTALRDLRGLRCALLYVPLRTAEQEKYR